MSYILSNALSWLSAQADTFSLAPLAAATTASAPAMQPTDPTFELYGLLAVGLVADMVLLAWFIRRILVRPNDRFGLARIPGRSNSLHPFHVLGLLIAWFGGMLGVSTMLGSILPETQAILVGGIVGQTLLLIGCLLVSASCFRGGIRHGVGLTPRRWRNDLPRGLIAYLAILPPCVLMLYIGEIIIPIPLQEHPLLKNLSELTTSWRILSVFSGVVMAPLAEEIFFRGIIQSMLRRYSLGPVGAVFLTSAFFAMVHVNTQPQAVPALFVLSLALGHNYERTGRLMPSIIIHAAFNTVAMAATLSLL